MLSTWKDRCGIADYTRRLVEALSERVSVEVISLDAAERSREDFHASLAARTAHFDVVHVQHEYSFFGGGTAPPEARRPRWVGSLDWPAPSRFFELQRAAQAPLVLTLHELLDGEKLSWSRRHARFTFLNRLNRYANRLTFAPADRVITHSRERRERLISMGVPAERIRVVPIGIAAPPAAPPAGEARARLGLEDRFVLAIFGFVNWRKGHLHAIELLPLLPERVVLLIAGGAHPNDTSDYAQRVERRARELGVTHRVRTTGYLREDEIPATLAAADVVLAPYDDMGGSSTSILTAVSAGRPVVARALPQIEELQQLLGCFVLADRSQPGSLQARVRELVESPERLTAAERATRQAALRWSTNAEAEQVLRVYEETTGAPRPLPQRVAASRWRWLAAARALG
jgi:glycosyltransferase involved in cell wall biosynthesis